MTDQIWIVSEHWDCTDSVVGIYSNEQAAKEHVDESLQTALSDHWSDVEDTPCPTDWTSDEISDWLIDNEHRTKFCSIGYDNHYILDSYGKS